MTLNKKVVRSSEISLFTNQYDATPLWEPEMSRPQTVLQTQEMDGIGPQWGCARWWRDITNIAVASLQNVIFNEEAKNKSNTVT